MISKLHGNFEGNPALIRTLTEFFHHCYIIIQIIQTIMSSSRSIRVVEILTKSLVESFSGSLICTRHVSKRTKRGLFDGKRVLSGNNVSEDGGNRYECVMWCFNCMYPRLN